MVTMALTYLCQDYFLQPGAFLYHSFCFFTLQQQAPLELPLQFKAHHLPNEMGLIYFPLFSCLRRARWLTVFDTCNYRLAIILTVALHGCYQFTSSSVRVSVVDALTFLYAAVRYAAVLHTVLVGSTII